MGPPGRQAGSGVRANCRPMKSSWSQGGAGVVPNHTLGLSDELEHSRRGPRAGTQIAPGLGGFSPADQPSVASIRTLRAARFPRLICAYALPQTSRPSCTASAPRPIPLYPSRSDSVALKHRWLPTANRGGAKRKRQEKGVWFGTTPLCCMAPLSAVPCLLVLQELGQQLLQGRSPLN